METRDEFLDPSTWQDVPDSTVPGFVRHQRLLKRGKVELIDHGNGTYQCLVYFSSGHEEYTIPPSRSAMDAKRAAYNLYSTAVAGLDPVDDPGADEMIDEGDPNTD